MTNTTGITANFGALNPNQVSLTVWPNGNGSVSVNPSKNVYTNGESVTLTATHFTNYIFNGWTGDASAGLNPLVVTLDSSKSITANFVSGNPTNPPMILQSPFSRTLNAGSSTVLSFQAAGDSPFSYQWRFNTLPKFGATNPTLLLTNITPAEAGLYDVVVTGPAGTATSVPASVALFGLELALSGSQLVPLLTLDGAPGTHYRIDFSTNLIPTNWSLLAPVTLQGNRFYYVDTAVTNDFKRFYRAMPQ